MERRLRISAHIPLQPLSRISAAKEKSCAKGLFDEKYNNNPKYSLIEGRLLPCLSFILSGLALCECNIGVASSVGVVKTKLGLPLYKRQALLISSGYPVRSGSVAAGYGETASKDEGGMDRVNRKVV